MLFCLKPQIKRPLIHIRICESTVVWMLFGFRETAIHGCLKIQLPQL